MPSTFQRKQYIAIAATIAHLPQNDRARVVDAFARTFAADNPKFKPSVFARACQLEPVDGPDPRD